ncbi:MAG: hypothetical protein JWP47_638 [Polaromonas sp.]|jgi:hypothetical protein|nr:hypothetical protein [Polaromonas sp.]
MTVFDGRHLPYWRLIRTFFTASAAVLLVACSSAPRPADWQLEARRALDRAVAAYLEGNSRVEAMEFERARAQIASTGRVDLAARAELVHCASHVASLVFEPCTGFERWRQGAEPAERAYADYLAGRLRPADAGLLPAPQKSAAAGGEAAISGIAEPLSRLVAAGVALQAGQATAPLIALAVETASAQGWRRPLLAWLGVQLVWAEKNGLPLEAEGVRRRLALAQGSAQGGR